MNPKLIALWFLIVSVALSALIGVIAILSRTFGETQERILMTTLTISGTSICAMSCGAFWERGRAKIVPIAGIGLAIVTAALMIIGIWAEISRAGYWRFSASVALIAVATAHACLIALAKLAPRFGWSKFATFLAAYTLAALFVYVIYFQPTEGSVLIRVIGVTSIVLAALTILTPIFHRLSRGDLTEASSPARQLHATITCPRCGAALPNSAAEIKCHDCGCVFRVTIVD